MKKVTVLGANPAFQKTLTFDGFRQGKVNRAKDVTFTASGKGINFCRAARCWNLVVCSEKRISQNSNNSLNPKDVVMN